MKTNSSYLYIKACSDLGANMDMVVLASLIYGETHSTAWLSASFGIRVLGGLLSSLISGVMADRFNRSFLMIGSDLLRAVLVWMIILVPHAGFIVTASFLIGFFSSFFQVSFSAAIPVFFGETRIVETNSLISRLTSAALVLGFFGASLFSKYGGYQAILEFDSLSYIASAAFLLLVCRHSLRNWKIRRIGHSDSTGSCGSILQQFRQMKDDLIEVKGYLSGQLILVVTFSVYLIETFGASSHNLGIPLLAAKLDEGNQAFWYGLFWGVWGLGNILCTFVLPKMQWVRAHLFQAYLCSTFLMSCGFIAFLSTSSIWLILPFAFGTGIADAGSGTLYSILLQSCDNEIRGRMFGVSTLVNRLGFGVGFLVAPLLLTFLSLAHMVWVLHGCILAAVLTAAFVFLKKSTRMLERSDLQVE